MMASGFRCLSLRAACPNPIRTKNSSNLDLNISRVYGASYPAVANSNGISLYTDKPKAVAIPRFQNIGDIMWVDQTTTNHVYDITNKQMDTLIKERNYAALSLIQHIQAQKFFLNYEDSSTPQLTSVSLTDVPELRSSLAVINQNSFAAYFSSQLSQDEKNLLSFKGSTEKLDTPEKGSFGLPAPDQLQHVFDVLSTTLPRLFIKPLDYTIYSPDIVFENRIRGMRSVGIYKYVQQVALLRCVGHIKYAYVHFQILKITQHPEDGTIRVRWRISGISGMKILLTFWRYKLWEWKEMMGKQEAWYDGFSTFHVSSEGRVVLHVADKMMPDQENLKVDQTPLAAKLALLIGLLPRNNWSDMTEIADNLLIKLEDDEP